MFCIDKAMQFMTEKDHLSFASEWIYSEKITIDHEELSCPLTDQHRYAIVQNYNASTHFSVDQKKELVAKAFEKDQTDAGK